jgi:hypothetical protein
MVEDIRSSNFVGRPSRRRASGSYSKSSDDVKPAWVELEGRLWGWSKAWILYHSIFTIFGDCSNTSVLRIDVADWKYNTQASGQ